LILIKRFPFTFGALSDADSLFQFRFKKMDVLRMVNAVGWPDGMTQTTRNRYEVCPLLVTCVILRSAASPGRWRDSECFFGSTSRSLVKYFGKDWSTLWIIEGYPSTATRYPQSGAYKCLTSLQEPPIRVTHSVALHRPL
jgi:hypothetical protein